MQYTGMVDIYKTLIPFNVLIGEDQQNFNSAPSKKAWVQGVTCVKEADFKRFVLAKSWAAWNAARVSGQFTFMPSEHSHTRLFL